MAKAELNREAWLTELAKRIVPDIEARVDVTMPAYRIAMGFPSRNALSRYRRVIGQCWKHTVSLDGVHELFISPMIHDPVEVAGTVVHELLHAGVGVEHGHKKPFAQAARKMLLEGKPTATIAGRDFADAIDPILRKLPPYPHSGMVVDPTYKAPAGRMLKVECPVCSFKARITRAWLENEEYGAPICPKHKKVMVEAEAQH